MSLREWDLPSFNNTEIKLVTLPTGKYTFLCVVILSRTCIGGNPRWDKKTTRFLDRQRQTTVDGSPLLNIIERLKIGVIKPAIMEIWRRFEQKRAQKPRSGQHSKCYYSTPHRTTWFTPLCTFREMVSKSKPYI